MQPPRLRWVIYAAVVSFLVAVLLTSFFRELNTIDRLSGTLDKRMESLVKEKRKTQELKQKLQYYSTPEGMARLAREKFNLVQSGEKIYKIEVTSVDSPDAGKSQR
ncbi:MAG: septum formation initiator family protein [Synergistaceae bacterium]|nr:septum formation initiator family protein [Synergistaceae bacterium]